jgi:hypothetical protein
VRITRILKLFILRKNLAIDPEPKSFENTLSDLYRRTDDATAQVAKIMASLGRYTGLSPTSTASYIRFRPSNTIAMYPENRPKVAVTKTTNCNLD